MCPASVLTIHFSQLQHASRVNVVWDEYLPGSRKANTRSMRGKGIRRRVEPSSVILINWQEFLRIDDKKIELLSFLATTVVTSQTEKSQQIITNHRRNVLCTQPREVSGLAPCSHKDAVKQWYTNILIRTVDTDVLVLTVTAAQRLDIAQLLIAFGVGRNCRYLSAHQMTNALGQERSVALHMFYAFTGWDTVLFFNGRGKKTA